MASLIDSWKLDFETIEKSIIKTILANITCEIIPLKSHYYWTLFALEDWLNANGFFIKSSVAELLRKISSSKRIKNLCGAIDTIFDAKNYFIYELFFERRYNNKFSFTNYGTTFTMQKCKFVNELIENFYFMLNSFNDKENIKNTSTIIDNSKILIDISKPLIKYLKTKII